MAGDSMNRREFLKRAGVGAAILGLSAYCPASLVAARKPNIIVIVSDDHGYAEIGPQGGDIPTPNIDSIAKNGIRFTNGYVSCPVCSPTRAGLMTGRYQQRFGHEFNPGPATTAAQVFGLPLTETTLAARLKAAGYRTACIGKWHLGYNEEYRPLKRGFDEFFGFLGGAHPYFGEGKDGVNRIMRGNEPVEEKEYLTDAFGREAVSFIEKHSEEPFFLYLAFNAVHSPLQAPEKYLKRFSSQSDEKRRTFSAMLSAMDDNVGRVLKTLREKGLEDNTLIFFVSDNGGPTRNTTSRNDPLRGYKGEVYEGGIRVPFLVQWKGTIPAGKTYEQPVISLDIAPTACAVAGASTAGAKFDGVDLLPYLTGRKTDMPHQTLYWRYGNQSAIRSGDWKLVNTPGGVELYNLKEDIREKNNVADRNPDKVKELAEQYEKWNSQLAAPLWRTQRQRQPRARKAARKRA